MGRLRLHYTVESQAKVQGDGIPGDLITAHPKLLRDGRTLVNFSRSIPAGGFHVFTQVGPSSGSCSWVLSMGPVHGSCSWAPSGS